MRELDPRIPVYQLRTLEGYVEASLAPRRFALTLLLGYAALGLLCAGVGLYGMVAFEVGRRRREMAVRLAVGATPWELVRAMLSYGTRMGAGGVAAGLAVAAVAALALEDAALVDAGHPLPWVAAGGVVLAVTLVATLGPAIRASRLEAVEALRAD